MKVGQTKIDRYMLSNQTYNQKTYGERSVKVALAWRDDAEKVARRAEMKCKTCFYFGAGRLAGQAFTSRPCAICAEVFEWANTGIPALCKPCAKKTRLCIQCGADRELKQRRGELPFTVVVAEPPPKTSEFSVMLLPPKKPAHE